MTEFKQDDIVSTRCAMESHDGSTTIGKGSIGQVTVVGIELSDGSVNGIEVLFDKGIYGHYNTTQLTAKITPAPTENLAQEEPTKYTLTRENYVEVAKWIGPDVRISSPWKNPRLHFETGFAEPGFKTTASIGDTIEKLPDGKFQIWVHESNVAADEPPPSMRADMKKEDRPSEMKKFRTGDPLTQARTMVYQLFYVGKAPLYDIYVVWFSSVLNGWKALVSTNVLDNCYYEVTHDGAKGRTYVDRYVKETNVTVHDNGGTDFKQISDFGRIW